MISIEHDPVIGHFFDTPEKKARWLFRIKIAYFLWILFVIIGIISVLLHHLLG